MNEPFLTSRLADFLSWRDGVTKLIDNLRGMLERHEMLDEAQSATLDDVARRIAEDRLTIAFIAEAERGKSELINALFFSERRRRLLPSGPSRNTLCVTELRYDRELPVGVRLLPIETRESSSSYLELLKDSAAWREIPFVYEDFDSIQRALGALSETRRVTLGEALTWGLHGDAMARAPSGNSTLVDVPRWRHAIINMPHPVLQAGLVVIDTPGLAALAAEPELSRQRLPGFDCVVFIIDARHGIAKSDLGIWRDYLGGKPGAAAFGRTPEPTPVNRLVALNKIDLLYDEATDESEVLRDIDKLVKDAADLLRVDPIRVVPISARLGFIGKTAGDRDKLLRSRLYQIERGITRELGNARQISLAAEARRIVGAMLDEAQARLDEGRYEMLGKLRALAELRERNQRLLGNLVGQATTHLDRYEAVVREMRGVRLMHARLTEELAALSDRQRAKQHATETADALAAAVLPGAVEELVDGYLRDTRAQVMAMEQKIEEIKQVYRDASAKLSRELGVTGIELLPFSTQRFLAEMQKAEVQAEDELKRPATLLLKRGTGLADRFRETAGQRILYLFEIAARESHLWMRGMQTALEKAFERVKDSSLQRAQGTEKLKMADIDLAEKIAELQAQLDIMKSRHGALAEAHASLQRQLGNDQADAAA